MWRSVTSSRESKGKLGGRETPSCRVAVGAKVGSCEPSDVLGQPGAVGSDGEGRRRGLYLFIGSGQ